MDDLIVIILTLIIAGIGALGQLKKKKQTQSGSEENKNAPGSFWDLIQGESEFIRQEDVSEFEEPEFESKTDLDVQEEVQKRKPAYSFDGDGEGLSEVENDVVKTAGKSKLKSGVLADFSLRKAVIYSEILNRKYT